MLDRSECHRQTPPLGPTTTHHGHRISGRSEVVFGLFGLADFGYLARAGRLGFSMKDKNQKDMT